MKKIKNTINKIGSSKVLIFVLLIIVQIMFYVGVYHFLYNRISFILGGFTILSILIVLFIINTDTNSTYKMSWIIIVLAFQGMGSIFYLFIHFDSLYKTIKNYYKKSKLKTSSYLIQNEKVKNELKKDSSIFAGISNYCQNGGYPTYKNTKVEYLKIGEIYYEKLLEELKKAKKFILLEYFIINNDFMWQNILNILIKKVKEGVEVRVMYDGFGSLITLPPKYNEYLERYGIKTAIFQEVKPLLAIHQNNRDHRKIVVIDGEVGFTGGINLADEYINKKVRFGHWKDTGVMLKGDAVNSLTMMFFELWGASKKEKIEYENYLSNKKEKEDGYIIPFSDSPFDNINLAEDIYLNIINSSNDYLYITTPYLILDDHLIKALDNAVKRGVKVVIIVPHIPDKKYIYNLAVSVYKMLVSKGIEIYEYTPGFIHAKMFLSDDKVGVVGTVNLDYRSLYLHFECGVLMYDSKALKDIKEDIEDTILKSVKVTENYIKKIPITKKIIGRILKIFAPLM